MIIPDYRNPKAEQMYLGYLADPASLPVRFRCGETEYRGLPEHAFRRIHAVKYSENGLCKSVLTFEKIDDGLKAELTAAFCPAYGALEWTLRFYNDSTKNSCVISDFWCADMVFPGADPILKGIFGDHENLYKPYARPLESEPVKFVSDSGRPTHVYFPYFNLEHGGSGTLIALGWGGTWTAEFSAGENGAHFRALGTNGLSTYLMPGESVRTPLTLLIPYSVRDEDYAANLWRRWFIEYNQPRKNAAGDPLTPISTTCLSCDTGLPNSDGSISERSYTWKPSLEKMFAEGIHADYRWFDAGWYFDPYGKTVESDWHGTIGSWELDTEKWPAGSFRESTDYARAYGMKTLVWFEPERVTNVEGLVQNYGYKAEWALGYNGRRAGNNLGDPDCLKWTAGRILKMLGENKVELYREDNNFNARSYWAKLDEAQGPARAGITENKAVCGHYSLWDTIIAFTSASGGDAFVDSCASGGGRNDLESMRRGVPLLRSDNDRTTTALRLSMTTSFNKWIPFCGALTQENINQLDPDGVRDKYVFRASYLPVLNFAAQWTQKPGTDFEIIRWGLREWDRVKEYLLKDFYALTPWHGPEDKTNWTVFEFFDPEAGRGVLQAFRMEEAAAETCTVKIKGLEPDVTYVLVNEDTGEKYEASGRRLLGGFTVRLASPRSAAIFWISEK